LTDTTEVTPTSTGDDAEKPRRSRGLATMLLPELKQVAGGLGIKATGMKKAELVAAIRAAQGGGASDEGSSGDRGSDPDAGDHGESG